MMTQPIGLLGGTFDPIHMGHLRLALEAYEILNLSKVHLIPCYLPVHRDPPVAGPDIRLNLVKQAIGDEPALQADPIEIDLKKPMYTIDTLELMRQKMPHTPFCLILGLDAFLDFQTWHRFRDILSIAHLIIAKRPDSILPDSGELHQLLNNHLQTEVNYIHQHLAGGILLLPIPELPISASSIRKQFAMGRNPRYLLPDNVYHTIKQHGIYD